MSKEELAAAEKLRRETGQMDPSFDNDANHFRNLNVGHAARDQIEFESRK